MPYVSARYAPPDATGMTPEAKDGERPVIATDSEGAEWFLTENSQVGDWLRFMEEGGTVLVADEEGETLMAKEKGKTDKDNKNSPDMYQDPMRNIAAGGTGKPAEQKPQPKPQPKKK